MKNKLYLLTFLFLLLRINVYSQSSESSPKLIVTGYVDAYYAYYNDSVGIGNFQKFPSISPRSKQFGLNTAQLSFQYDAEKIRGLATLHFGDIAKSAWSPTLNNVMEAHAGIRLFKKHWLDAGLFRTHFGTEGLLPKENFTSSVSINTIYEPYFEAGLRLNYNATDKLSFNLLALNGYNTFEDNNDKKSLGLLVTYAFGENGNLGYSNYIGDDTPNEIKTSHLRIHQNIFINYQIKKLKIQLGGDFCIQENSKINDKTKSATMSSGVLGLKYQLNEKIGIYGREELFNDPDGFMSSILTNGLGEASGYKLWGTTLGFEYKPTDSSYIRIEERQISMDKDQQIFIHDGKLSNKRLELLINFGISF